MKTFEKKVLWEFRTLVSGYGRNVKEALLDGLRQKIEDVRDPRHARLLQAIEEHEVSAIHEQVARPAPSWKPPPPPDEILQQADELVRVELSNQSLLLAKYLVENPAVPVSEIEIVKQQVENDGWAFFVRRRE